MKASVNESPSARALLNACEKKVYKSKEGTGVMKELADDFMKLLAIIMLMITLAVSTAAFSQVFG